MREVQVCSKNNGIDTDVLFDEKVIANERCFWSLLQSHSDRFNYFYYDEETLINKALSRLERKQESIRHQDMLISLSSVRERVSWLLEFISYNLELFATAVRTFDRHHDLETFDEEMDYFRGTYSFVDGQRLHNIISYIDMWSLDIKQRSSSCREKDQEKEDVQYKDEQSTNEVIEKSIPFRTKKKIRSSFLWKRSNATNGDDGSQVASSNRRRNQIATLFLKIAVHSKKKRGEKSM
ncbi:predicted protein [Chaetoceros tenuissimus]|uniref:Uncharacterized protein n=1 Tax=Chaetoceros tenuissimus TaxID=426638 RepID=A0AAD3CQ32_9STRA|nr:predicted protein [Chaetoceros tenuissimus]